MSVRKNDRKESNLQYVQDAHILAQHTIQMCNNEKHFPDKVLANAIKHEALEVLCNVRYNLATYTYDKQNKTSLKQHCSNVLAHIDALYGLLELAYNDQNVRVPAESMEHWIGLIIKTEESIKKLGSIPIC